MRDERGSVLGFGLAGFAMTLLQAAAYYRMAGHTAAEREAFGYALSLQATANAVLFPTPARLDTVGGYLELRAFAPLAILFAAWALVSATRSASPRIVARAARFAPAATIAAAAACVGALIGIASGGETINGLDVAGAGLLLVALAAACYAISLVVAQVTPAATLMAGALLLALYLLNSLSRIFTELATVRWLSPFRYYDLSTPIGFAALIAIALAGTGLAVVLSRRRAGAKSAPARPTYEPSRVRLLAWPVTRELYPQRVAYAAWCVGFTVLGIVLVVATRAAMQDVLSLPRVLPGLPQYIFVFYAQVLGQTWFDVALLLLVALVYAFVVGWANQDLDGRLEAELSAPYSRSAVLLERLCVVAGMAAMLVALSGLAVALTSRAADLALDVAHLAGACVLLIAFSVVLGAAGSLLTSWIPRAAPALFGGFALASYLDDQIGGALGLPSWVQTMSAFRLVGAPLAHGLDGRNLALLLLLAMAGLGTSILLMQRRDVGTSRAPAYQK
jgi:ABC-2 type transport system permease protein